jgi:hypothetical protein
MPNPARKLAMQQEVTPPPDRKVEVFQPGRLTHERQQHSITRKVGPTSAEQGQTHRSQAGHCARGMSIRAKLQLEQHTRDLVMFNLAIDSKLRGCDLVALRVDDVAPNGYALDRVTVRKRKTGRPVRFELTEVTRQALDEYLRASGRKPGQCLFPGRRGPNQPMTTRQYARLVSASACVAGLGIIQSVRSGGAGAVNHRQLAEATRHQSGVGELADTQNAIETLRAREREGTQGTMYAAEQEHPDRPRCLGKRTAALSGSALVPECTRRSFERARCALPIGQARRHGNQCLPIAEAQAREHGRNVSRQVRRVVINWLAEILKAQLD